MSNNNRQSHASQGVPQTHILGRRLMACAMSALLVTATPLEAMKAYAEEATSTSKDGSTSNATSTASKASSSTSAKDEIVYVKADATGSDTGVTSSTTSTPRAPRTSPTRAATSSSPTSPARRP